MRKWTARVKVEATVFVIDRDDEFESHGVRAIAEDAIRLSTPVDSAVSVDLDYVEVDEAVVVEPPERSE